MANFLKLLTNDKEIRIFLVEATSLLEESELKGMQTPLARQLYANIFVNCCLLWGFLTEAGQRITVSFRFKPEGCLASGLINWAGNVTCTFSSPLASFAGQFADLAGEGATLSITKGSRREGVFTGTVELKAPSIDACFSDFYTQSEQIKTIFRTWFEKGVARGCLVQPLPFAGDERLKSVLERIDRAENYLVTEEWTALPSIVFPDAAIVEADDLRSGCICSKEWFCSALKTLETAELEKFIEAGETMELACGICGKRYEFSPAELEMIVGHKEKRGA